MVIQLSGRALGIARSPHLWLLLAMFLVGIFLHYPEQLIGGGAPSSLLGLERHAMERVFFLLPAIYAGGIFGIGGGLAALAVALTIMLPRAVFLSCCHSDALFETGGVIVVGGLVNLWFESHRRQRQVLAGLLSRLEASQQKLQSQLRVIQMSESQLGAVHAICSIVSQSLELRDILNQAADKVMEVANLETILIFLVDEEADELVLETYRGITEQSAASVRRMKVGEGFNG